MCHNLQFLLFLHIFFFLSVYVHFDKILQKSNLEALTHNFMKNQFSVRLNQHQHTHTQEYSLAVFCQCAESRGGGEEMKSMANWMPMMLSAKSGNNKQLKGVI